MTERYNQLLQGLNMDAISKAEFRSWLMSEPIDVAESKLQEMEPTEGDI
jgi:hypothetical protein